MQAPTMDRGLETQPSPQRAQPPSDYALNPPNSSLDLSQPLGRGLLPSEVFSHMTLIPEVKLMGQ
jgi:hypothetical protein